MKSHSSIVIACLTVLACSSRLSSTDGDRSDAGAGGVNATDARTSDAGTSDAGTSDAGTSDAGTSDVGTGDVGAVRQPLCDGVRHLRVAMAYVGGGPGAPGSTVRSENGYSLFAVDGTCTYWIAGGWTDAPSGKDFPVRTGMLSDVDARVLDDSLPRGDDGALGGGCSPGLASDAPDRVIRTETMPDPCGQIPLSSAALIQFEAAWTTLRTIGGRLWEDGTSMADALHVSAVAASAGARPTVYAWPLALPLSGFVIDSSDRYKSGVSRLVDDPAAATQLRALRDRFLSDQAALPAGSGSDLLATDQSTTAFVYMRDAIPYEDARGLLQF
jgi:hypothetical protein